MTAAQQHAALERARTKLGVAFDKTGMIGLHDNPDKFYCSELVWWASFAMRRIRADRAVVADRHGTIIYWSGKRTEPSVLAANVRAERR